MKFVDEFRSPELISKAGEEIRKLVEQAMSSDERVNMPVHIVATVPSKTGNEPIANFTLTLSLKKKAK